MFVPGTEIGEDNMKHETTLKVRFCETDALGHVNNVSYFIYLETGRVEFLRALGTSMDAGMWNFILAGTKCDFIKQAYFDQSLVITTYVSRIGNSSYQLAQEILDESSGDLVAKAESTLIYFDFEQQKSKPITLELRAKLEYYMPETV